MPGPLEGTRVVELAGLGPGPFCAMLLADMGAEVLRIGRLSERHDDPPLDLTLQRGRRTLRVDLKQPRGVDFLLRLVEGADVLMEGFRPGVAERLGVGPEACLDRNPRLVYGRMTGWGQEGPLADVAGHDINYIALAGALDHIGRRGEPPVPPINLVGDFGGGGMLLAFGVVCALLERERSGRGQVVDAAMVDGAALLMTMLHGARAFGRWSDERGTNLFDTGAHFYDVYETADGRYVSVGAFEPQFYAELCRRIGIEEPPEQMDTRSWPSLKQRFAAIFKTRTRDEWCALLEGTDACFAPVLSMAEAPSHPHNRARDAFVEVGGVVQPAPAPRFSRSQAEIREFPGSSDAVRELLEAWGLDRDEAASFLSSGVTSELLEYPFEGSVGAESRGSSMHPAEDPA